MQLVRSIAQLLIVALLLGGSSWTARAADAETRAFNNAEAARQDGFNDRAEKAFADFITRFPASPRVPQALLLQSKAALQQRKYQPAIQLLLTNLAAAGGMADQFRLAIANTFYESSQFEAAATNYSAVVTFHTNSPLRLEATLGEARSRFQLKQWPRVIALLQAPAGLFQEAVSGAPDSDIVVRGKMLLAETFLQERNYAAAERAAASIPTAKLPTKGKWEREFLIAQAQWGARQLEQALATTSNLQAHAAAAADAALDAASSAMQGEILEALDRPEEAVAAYARNQRPGVPAGRAREAVFKTVELRIAQGQLTNAMARLQEFISANPSEATSDIALLTLAELRLKQHQMTLGTSNAPAAGDLLTDAIFDCEKLIAQFTNSPFVSRAHYIRGWALLAQGKTPASLAAFRTAAATLPWSEAHAVAHFKAADLEFQAREFTNAIRNYREVIQEYEALPRVQSELVPRARYQMLQASLAAENLAAAEEALEAIVREFPGADSYSERALLLFGQAVDEMGDARAARKQFQRFVEKYPNSPLRPEVELAVARSYERERDWAAAVTQYNTWLKSFATNGNRPRAEFLRALATYHSGRESNALTLFTNFVAQFPVHPLAARAQNWVGDHHFRAGEYDDALRNYQRVFENTNWPVTILSYQARLKAGRAALLRPDFGNAAYYLTNLLNDANCPTSVLVQAYFAYGDAYALRPSTNVLENYNNARTIYGQVPRFFPIDDPLVPKAWGQMANCSFQLGSADPVNYADALDYYAKVTNSPAADGSTRQQAQVGIGNVQRSQAALLREKGSASEAAALLNAALTNYLDVVFSDRDGETPDPLWLKEATLSAADICETQGEWDRAVNLCRRLAERLPALRTAMDKRIESIKRRMEQRSL